jgi:hypothetical protein
LTAGERRGSGTQSTGYVFVDTGGWALVSTPGLPIRFSGVGSRPDVTKTYRVNGSGVVGRSMAYLGPHETHRRRAGGQRFRLVVPRAAEPAERPERVLDSLGAASTRLAVGQRDEEVLGFVAPTTVGWGAPGLQRGEYEFWVQADQRLDRAGSIWLHEYVHTRQAARADDSARWFVEGSAEYYAALLTLRQGHIDFATFRDHLTIGTRDAYEDDVLADRDDWEGTGANYWKGALVAGAVDRQVRLATDRERALADAHRRVNDERNVSNRDLLAAVGAVADRDTRRYARRYTRTSAAPPLWNESQHEVAFRRAANVSTNVTRIEVRGPYRNATVTRPAMVVPSERLQVQVRITNEGRVAGTYRVALWKDGERVGEVTGELAPGEGRTAVFETGFETRGRHLLAVRGEEMAVSVRKPATPTVTGVDALATVAPGEEFTVAASVRNDADRPAEATVPVTVDGEQVASRTVRLAPGAATTVSAAVRLRARGEHAVGVGGVTTTVQVPEDATSVAAPTTAPRTGTTDRTGAGTTRGAAPTTGADGVGFGTVAALLALVLTAALRAWERR